jgi:hypothetical protein
MERESLMFAADALEQVGLEMKSVYVATFLLYAGVFLTACALWRALSVDNGRSAARRRVLARE